MATKEKEPQDDYAVFPALEEPVQESLIATPPSIANTLMEDLPEEIHGRLSQIYGFNDFNFPCKDDDSAESDESSSTMSLGDMLLSNSDDDDSSKSSILSLENNNLLSGPSSSSSAKSDEKPKNSSIKNDLNKLPQFQKLQILHVDPLVLLVDDFFTAEECDRYIAMTENPNKKDDLFKTNSKTVGKDSKSKAQRTSTTWFHHYKHVPELMAKASRLLGLEGIDNWEEPQTVRYRRSEKFTWHLDALGPAQAEPEIGGQRTATLLVYLTDLGDAEGGATMFRDLGGVSSGPLRVQPKKGSALLFFPGAGAIPDVPIDIRTLHCGEAVSESSSNDKWIGQMWLRESKYVPTAPAGNIHSAAKEAIAEYCRLQQA